jgi:hypothetical protein
VVLMADAQIYCAAVVTIGHTDDLSEAWFLRNIGKSGTALRGGDLSVSLYPGSNWHATNWSVAERQQALVQNRRKHASFEFRVSSFELNPRSPAGSRKLETRNSELETFRE